MLQPLYESLRETTPVAIVIISVAIMLFCGFFMTRLTRLVKLPNVTAYIVAGILIGPYVLNLVPPEVLSGTEFLPDIALAFIAFSTGQFFRVSVLKKNGIKVLYITLAESLIAAVAVFIVTYFLLGLSLPFSIVLSALATATAPASTMMTIRQTGAKGDFVDTLLQVVALDDIVGLVAYSVAVSIAVSSLRGEAFSVVSILLPLAKNLGIMLVGGFFGLLMKWILSPRSTDNRLIIAIALLFAFCGIAAMSGISPLLGCMMMGMVYINTTDDERLFKQLNYFSPPILLLFFVRSGISFDLGALVSTNTTFGAFPLAVIGVVYFFVRILGKYGGAWLGCFLTGKGHKVRDFLGLALIPQAGVAIGLAVMGARALGGESGSALQTIILASSVLYELIGPASAKLSLYLSGSYSDKIEEVAPVEEVRDDGSAKPPVEILIERIRKIQEMRPAQEIDENEQAFTQAAEEYYDNLYSRQRRRRRR